MAAVIAIDQESEHVLLSGVGVLKLSHAGPLPWVLNGIGKDDVGTGDIETSVFFNVEVDLRLTDLGSEDGLAHGNPISDVNERGSERMNWVGGLEPSELSAVLPCPLTHVILAVHLDVGESNSVILIQCDSMLVGVLLQNRHLQFHVSSSDAHENVAKLSAAAILNTKSESVSHVEHEVTVIDALRVEDAVNELLIFRGQLIGNCLLKVVSNVLNNLRAESATSVRSGVDVKIEVCEVLDGKNHT